MRRWYRVSLEDLPGLLLNSETGGLGAGGCSNGLLLDHISLFLLARRSMSHDRQEQVLPRISFAICTCFFLFSNSCIFLRPHVTKTNGCQGQALHDSPNTDPIQALNQPLNQPKYAQCSARSPLAPVTQALAARLFGNPRPIIRMS